MLERFFGLLSQSWYIVFMTKFLHYVVSKVHVGLADRLSKWTCHLEWLNYYIAFALLCQQLFVFTKAFFSACPPLRKAFLKRQLYQNSILFCNCQHLFRFFSNIFDYPFFCFLTLLIRSPDTTYVCRP